MVIMANKNAAQLIAANKQLQAEQVRVAEQLAPKDLLDFRTVTDWISEAEISTLPPETLEAFHAVVRLVHPLLSELATVLD